MTDKELRKLRRGDLLEILVMQGHQLDALHSELAACQDALADRRIKIDNAGSIAEAALGLNEVFAAAQQAAAQYLENTERLNAEQSAVLAAREKACQQQIEAMEAEAEARCQQLVAETEARCRQMSEETEARCRRMDEETEARRANLEEEVAARCREANAASAARCKKLEQETLAMCRSHYDQTMARCQAMQEKARAETEAYWVGLSRKLKAFYDAHAGLRELLPTEIRTTLSVVENYEDSIQNKQST